MVRNKVSTLVIAASLALSPATRVAADGGDVAAGVLLGVVGSAIVRDAQKKKTTSSSTKTVSSATRTQNRQVQTSLNYFGFPAGTPDGVMGKNSRAAVSGYQTFMGYPVTGYLTEFERDFLLNSYNRAVAGGAATAQLIAANPQGARGLLRTYRDEMAGVQTATTAPATAPAPAAAPVTTAQPDTALPSFMGNTAQVSLASHCNKVSLLTSSNGGFTTLASMSDPEFALSEQFCLARTYAIAAGEDMATKVQGFTPDQIEAQCAAFGPAMQEHVAALSLKPAADVLRDVSGFVLQTGMSPTQLSGTAKICLSVGYRTDQLDVAIGSALLLVALGEHVYGELPGHHLSQGFGATQRMDLAVAWYDTAVTALEDGAEAVFAPGQPDRAQLLHKAAYGVGSGGGQTQQGGLLPAFAVSE